MSFFKEDTRQVPFFLLGHDLLRVLFFVFFWRAFSGGRTASGDSKRTIGWNPKMAPVFFVIIKTA